MKIYGKESTEYMTPELREILSSEVLKSSDCDPCSDEVVDLIICETHKNNIRELECLINKRSVKHVNKKS